MLQPLTPRWRVWIDKHQRETPFIKKKGSFIKKISHFHVIQSRQIIVNKRKAQTLAD